MRKEGLRAGWGRLRRAVCRSTVGLLVAVSLVGGIAIPAHGVTKEEDAAAVKGIDVSGYNGTVDFAAVKKQGYTYVMIRAGAGKDTVDSCFAQNYGGAGSEGLNRGAYYYSYATTVEEAQAEADKCLSILDNRNLECPVAYDIEEDAAFATGKDNVTAMAVAFCEKIKAAGYEPMIYASLNKLKEYFAQESISQYKIWVANYDVDYPDYAYPYMMWQYQIGSVKGANTSGGQCDENYIYESFTEAQSITLNQSEAQLQIGEGLVSSVSLQGTVSPENASNRHINWSSADEKVATVDSNGTVQAVGNGTVQITASTVNGKTAVCEVTVTTPATAVAIGNESLTIGKKENFSLTPVLTPETSTDETHYVSADPDVVRVEEDGTLTGLKKGSAKITATTDSGVSTEVTVTVKKAPWWISNGGLFKKMKVGESYQMNCKLSKNAASNQIDYYSRNQYRVAVDEDGKVTALAAGWCLIRARTYNGRSAWTLVHVVE